MSKHQILPSERVDAVPGTNLYRTTSPAVSVDGREWPAGTEYTPVNAGKNNVTGRDYRSVVIRGATVMFEN